MTLFKLTYHSLKKRAFTSILCILSIALSVTLFLSVEKMRDGAQKGFVSTLSGADLIVGARGGSLQLLMYSIFHMGDAVNNIRYSSYEKIKNNPLTAWTIPISLGDSYKGHRVVGTDSNFFEHYMYRGKTHLEMQSGEWPKENLFGVVLGSGVARKLGHKLGDKIFLSHGVSDRSLMAHNNAPFTVVGIIKPTATPIDKSVFVSLEAIEAIHIGWETGMPNYNNQVDLNSVDKKRLQPTAITSFIYRTKSRIMLLRVQRMIQDFEREPLMAIIPGMTLTQLWSLLSTADDVLKLVSLCVLVVGLIGIIIALYTSLNERRREMAILRALGASLFQIFLLFLFESIFIVVSGILVGVGMTYLILFSLAPFIESSFSLYLPITGLGMVEVKILIFIALGGILAGLIPAIRAYKQSLSDGLSMKS